MAEMKIIGEYPYAKHIAGTVFVALVIAAGAVLPGEFASGMDRAILGQIRSEALDTAEISEHVITSMADKVGLLSQSSATILVRLTTGAVFDPERLRPAFEKELQKLIDMGFYPDTDEEIARFSSGATLYIKNDAPAINMILWEINIRSESLNGVFYMDDQTGKILSFTFNAGGFGHFVYTERLPGAWAAYLGAELGEVRKDPAPERLPANAREDLYRFSLFSGANGIGGQLGSSLRGAASGTNRWHLHYLQLPADE